MSTILAVRGSDNITAWIITIGNTPVEDLSYITRVVFSCGGATIDSDTAVAGTVWWDEQTTYSINGVDTLIDCIKFRFGRLELSEGKYHDGYLRLYDASAPNGIVDANILLIMEDPDVAFDPTPTLLFPGMTSDGTSITIPIADLSAFGLDAAKANPTTGDSRAILRALAARGYAWYKDIAPADRPTGINCSVRTSLNQLNHSTYPGALQETIQIVTNLDYPTENIVDEV